MAKLDEDQRAGHCRQCGERLPLIKRVKREEFCSEEHREKYFNSTQTVALSRLQELKLDAEPELVAATTETSGPSWGASIYKSPPAEAPRPDPPMAGSIAPTATRAPYRLAVMDDEDLGLGQCEPIKPEPEWHNLALRFGLAEFRNSGPEVQDSPGAMAPAEHIPRAPSLELAMPFADTQLEQPTRALNTGAALLDALSAPEPHAAGLAGVVEQGVRVGRAVQSRVFVIAAEPAELDTIVYLPEFSPGTPTGVPRLGNWPEAALRSEDTIAPLDADQLKRLVCTNEEYAQTPGVIELPRTSGCSLETGDAADPMDRFNVEEAARDEADGPPENRAAEAEEGMEAALAADMAPALIVEQPVATEATAALATVEPIEDFLSRVEPIAAAAKQREERGMREALETYSGEVGSQGLGTRFAQPFLHEPQPRAGSAKPRWTPATASLGSGAEVMTEDWDIL